MSPTWFYTCVAGGSLMLSMWQPVDAATESWIDSPRHARATTPHQASAETEARGDSQAMGWHQRGPAHDQGAR